MACMEHVCFDCDWVTFDNKPTANCPFCGAKTRNYFDEPDDDDSGPHTELDELEIEDDRE